MKFRMLQALEQFGFKTSDAGSRSLRLPLVKSTGPLRARHFELSEFTRLSVHADVDLLWSPGPARARLRLHENFLRYLKIEQTEMTLSISSSCKFEGELPRIEISGASLLEVHIGAGCSANIDDILCSTLLVSAFDRSCLRVRGRASELHVEARQEAVIDCASLICDIAIADLSGQSVVFLRPESALQADASEACHLLTIGSPRVIDVAHSRSPDAPRHGADS